MDATLVQECSKQYTEQEKQREQRQRQKEGWWCSRFKWRPDELFVAAESWRALKDAHEKLQENGNIVVPG